MAENQYNNFVYCCQSLANNAHFDEDRYIVYLLGDKTLEEESFHETIVKNKTIVANTHFGVCFTFTCWAYHLLWDMGITSGYYLLETTEKGTGYPNYVLLFNYNGEYRICDLAAQVIQQEKVHKRLLSLSKFPNSYTSEDKEEILKSVSDSKFITQSLKDYFKEYNGGLIIAAEGLQDKRIFTEVPQMFLQDFLKFGDEAPKFKM